MWFSLASFANKAVGLVTTLLMLRFLDTYEFGLYKLILALYGILSLFFFSGIDQIVLADFMRAKHEKNHALINRIMLEFFFFKVIVGVLLFGATFFGARFAESWYGADIAHLVKIIAFLFLIVAVERIMNLIFNYYLAFRAMALFTFFEETTKLLFLLFFIFVVGLGVSGVVLAIVTASGITFLLFLPYAIVLAKRLPRVSPLKTMVLPGAFLSYGKWAVGLRYLNDFQRNVRPWFIKYFLSTEAVGIYAIAESLYGQIVGLFPLATVLLPTVAQNIKDRVRIKQLLYYGVKYGTPFFILIGIVSLVVAPPLIHLVFPQHEASLPVFYLILIAIVTTGSGYILTAIFYAEREQRAHFFITASVLAVTLLGSATLIPLLGVYGSALEFILSALFFNAMRLRYIFKRYPELGFSPRLLFIFSKEDREIIRYAAVHAKNLIRKKFLIG